MRHHYAGVVYVTSGHDTEIRLTLEAMVDLVNALGDAGDHPADVRGLLDRHGFTRASSAPATSIRRVEARMAEMAPTLAGLATCGPCADGHVDQRRAGGPRHHAVVDES